MPVCLSFDVDWAPDCAIYELLNILERYSCRCIFFMTHNSPCNRLIRNAGHELGIHPNFFPGSSQGDDVRSVLDYLMTINPDARAFRTHGLLTSTSLLSLILDSYPQLQYDFSLYTPGVHVVRALQWSYDGRSCIRFPFAWEDDCQFGADEDSYRNAEPELLYIYNLHPIHIYLNSFDLVAYKELLRSLSVKGKLLSDANPSDLLPFINKSLPGSRDSLIWILDNYMTIGFDELLHGLT